MKIGFIGMGNMARAIASGFAASGAVSPQDMSAYAPHYDKLAEFSATVGMYSCRSVEELLERSELVIMAVKPYVVEGVLAQIRDRLCGKAIVSVVAGYDFARYQPLLAENVRVQYVMPNTPCMVRTGVLLFEEKHSLTAEERAWTEAAFGAIGEVVELPTHLMGAGMAVSGCGPAFVAMMLEAFADAGVRHGLPRATAYRLAAATALGTGKMQLDTGMLPAAIKDGVCSPGGTTIRGVEALEANGFRHAVMEAVAATLK